MANTAAGSQRAADPELEQLKDEWKPLATRVINSGKKLSPAKLVGIWELHDGKEIQGQTILWLEQGDRRSGLIQCIVHRHGAEFLQHNIKHLHHN